MGCVNRGSYFESDEFYSLILHILSCFQVPLNILGYYIVIWKSPKKMEKVKFSMLVLHSSCALMDVYYNIIALPVLIYPAVSGYPLGPLYHVLKVPSSIQVYIGFSILLILCSSVILFFEDRYNRLVRLDADQSSRTAKRAVHFSFNYIVALLGVAPVYLMSSNDEQAHMTVVSKFPCIANLINRPGFYTLSGDTRWLLSILFIFFFFYLPQVLFFLLGTILHLKKNKTQSERTMRMQRQFFKSLCIQAAVPLLVATTPCLYLNYTVVTSHVDILYGNLGMIWLTTHGIFSTITMLYIHKAYRIATFQLFSFKKWSSRSSPLMILNSHSNPA